MQANGTRATGYGVVAGALFGLAAFALFGPMTAIGSVETAPLGAPGGTTIVVTHGALFLALLIIGLAGGAASSLVGYAAGTRSDASVQRYPARYVASVGALLGAAVGFPLTRGLLALAGDIRGGEVTIPVLKMSLIAVVAGAAVGGMIAMIANTISYPRTIGFSGSAVPVTTAGFIRETGRAIGWPVIAGVTVATVAFSLSRLLLASSKTGAVILFSVVGAAVLGGAALFAARPWESTK
jgi:hypothetical protein